MPTNPPPLTALRAFEAAARHMSFAKAADELGVTPAALSFQIKTLEDRLGQDVFHRLNRAIELTDAGRTLLPGIAEAFGVLNTTWRKARRQAEARTLTVTAGPAFTAKWLSTRFFDFSHAHPGIELRFSASLRSLDFGRDDIDVALRFTSKANPDGLYSVTLFREWMTPMMSPTLAERISTPEDLPKEILLHQDDIVLRDPPIGWPEWFCAAGLPVPREGGPRFSQSDHAIDAAAAGAGVVLGRISLSQHALRAGQLVAPFPLALTNAVECRFLCMEGAETRPEIAAFRDWILSEVAEMAPLSENRQFIPVESIST